MQLIDEIPEYKNSLAVLGSEKRKLKKQKRAVAAAKRKIDKINRKYQFIEKIFFPNSSGVELEIHVCHLFQAIGYKNVRHITSDTRNPDIEIERNGKLTCVEVKSNHNLHENENEILQVLKYRNRRQEDLPNVEVNGLFVLNHQNKEPDISKRSQNPFDQHRERDAKLGKYSLISTLELLKGFILIKKNKLTFEQFDKVLHTSGIVRFSNRRIKEILGEL